MIVLNLRRSAERRAFMSAQAARHGIDFEFVDSVDAEELRARGITPPPGLSITEWACLLTHTGVWRRVGAGEQPAVVLEDDVDLSPSFSDVVGAIAHRLSGDTLVLLGHHSTFRPPRQGVRVCFWRTNLISGYRLGQVAEFAMGAYATLIFPGAARRLVGFSEPARMPADWVTGYSPRAGVRLLAVTPPCVTPAALASASTILDPCAEPGRSGNVRPELPRSLSTLWAFVRQMGIAPSAYALRLER